jgi:benzoyl-CoA reductase/2-hydroxyglutaryl-CoA dehydratase subunit BcrC/BadD/HgdB
MTTVAYCHPLVPPEWIAAHGLRPRWLQPERSPAATPGAARGACPYATAVVEAAARGLGAAALVLTTVCDQMRYAAAAIERRSRQPVFLLCVPSTWQTPAAKQLYLEELRRLGRFLVELGGRPPSLEELVRRMKEFETARSALLAAQDALPARRLAEEMSRLRSGELPTTLASRRGAGVSAALKISLAIVGGPLVEKDFDLFDLVERAGGHVALDATEGGTRMLPAAFDPQRMAEDPLAELARAYFDAVPDVFRRPNDTLFTWLGRQLAERGVRGLLFRRYVWCDLWHAELGRFRQWSPVPLLEIDVHHDDQGVPPRIAGRVEAFLEMLR